MRAAVLVQCQQAFEVQEVADPALLSPTDAIVEVEAAGSCRTDVHLWLGQFAGFREQAGIQALLFVCGHEHAGRIVEVGAGTTHRVVERALPLAHPGTTTVVIGAGGPGHPVLEPGRQAWSSSRPNRCACRRASVRLRTPSRW